MEQMSRWSSISIKIWFMKNFEHNGVKSWWMFHNYFIRSFHQNHHSPWWSGAKNTPKTIIIPNLYNKSNFEEIYSSKIYQKVK